jgi:PadR family transcriptional regulator, regulatory protein AphA
MSLEHAILGFLNYTPQSGYDLKKVFDTSVRHFWYADQSQIYRTLSSLTRRKFVEMEIVEQSDRPDRKVYHITEQGRTELRNWLMGPFPVQQPHRGPLVQIFFSGQLTDGELIMRFEMAAQIFRTILASYEQIPAEIDDYRKMVKSTREEFFGLSTLDLGKRTTQAQLDWAEQMIDQIKKGKIPEK